MKPYYPIVLLLISNVFMTFAWYGHLKNLAERPLWLAIVSSWAIAFFEYCFQVPGNRLGANYFSLPQLKIIQEAITLLVFVAFAFFYMGVKPSANYLYAALCIVAAVFFIFRDS